MRRFLPSLVSAASLTVLGVPVTVVAQTPQHPLAGACAAGRSPDVQTARLRLAIDERVASMVTLAVEAAPADTVVVRFTARAERMADAVPLGDIEVRHLLPGDAPQVLRSPMPVYPKTLLQDGLEGTVLVSYIVGADSTVTGAQVIAADHPAFGQAVLDVAPRLRVAPGTAGGCAVSSVARQRFAFRLGD